MLVGAGVWLGAGVLLTVAVLLAVAVLLGVLVGGSGVSVGVCGVGVGVTSITIPPQPDKRLKNREKMKTSMSLVVCFMIVLLSSGWNSLGINLTKEAEAERCG
jgi:amino acid transporter